ncbi:MFS transporter [Bacillus sp. 1A]|uniref:MFS transporter n=1 Tax=Bacillus sp. 1A TaxID=3461399 RepID=UPI004043A84D
MNVTKNNKVLLIIIASGFSFLGNGMHFIAISWLVLQITNNPVYVGILVAASTIPGIIISPFAGVIVDKFNKKILVILTDFIRGGLVLSIPAVIYLFDSILWYLFFVTILISASSNFFFPALSGIIKESFQKEILIKVFSANSTLIQIGMIAGTGLSGVIIAKWSINFVFIIDALTYIISAVLLYCVKYTPIVKSSANKITFLADVKAGLNYIWGSKLILFLFFIGLVQNSIVNIINSLLAVFTKDTLQLGATEYGMLDASFAVGSVIIGLALTSKTKNVPEEKLLTYGFGLAGISFFVLVWANNLYISLIGLFMLGASIMLTLPSRKSLLVKNVDGEFIGRVESLNWMSISSISPLIAVLFSFSSNLIGIRYIFFILTIILICTSLLCYWKLKVTSINRPTEKIS